MGRRLGATEADLLRTVVEMAGLLGWRTYHTWSSIHSAKGFPDLVLVRPPRCLFAELKSAAGRVTESQAEWLDALQHCDGVEAFVWRPEDLDLIERTLRS